MTHLLFYPVMSLVSLVGFSAVIWLQAEDLGRWKWLKKLTAMTNGFGLVVFLILGWLQFIETYQLFLLLAIVAAIGADRGHRVKAKGWMNCFSFTAVVLILLAYYAKLQS